MKWPPCVNKIVSGGQTGVDRGSLDAAIACGIPHGGWCPRGRRAEDGPIEKKYALEPTRSSDYRVRTRRNVLHSDSTLIFCYGPISGGTRLTRDAAILLGRPWKIVDFAAIDAADAIDAIDNGATAQAATRLSVWCWLAIEGIRVLNVAGPRLSGHGGIDVRTKQFLCQVLRKA